MKCVITQGEGNLVTDTIKLHQTAGAHGHEDLITDRCNIITCGQDTEPLQSASANRN